MLKYGRPQDVSREDIFILQHLKRHLQSWSASAILTLILEEIPNPSVPYVTIDSKLSTRLYISLAEIRTAKRVLIESGLVNIKVRGLPKATYYTVDFKQLAVIEKKYGFKSDYK